MLSISGVMYHGVDVDYKKAFEWFEKAAEQDTQMLSVIWVSCTSVAMAWM